LNLAAISKVPFKHPKQQKALSHLNVRLADALADLRQQKAASEANKTKGDISGDAESWAAHSYLIEFCSSHPAGAATHRVALAILARKVGSSSLPRSGGVDRGNREISALPAIVFLNSQQSYWSQTSLAPAAAKLRQIS